MWKLTLFITLNVNYLLKIYFIFQEFFTAFAAIRLPVDEFQEFVGKLFPRIGEDERGRVVGVGEDSFAIIRVLIIGCFNEIKTLVLGLLFN